MPIRWRKIMAKALENGSIVQWLSSTNIAPMHCFNWLLKISLCVQSSASGLANIRLYFPFLTSSMSAELHSGPTHIAVTCFCLSAATWSCISDIKGATTTQTVSILLGSPSHRNLFSRNRARTVRFQNISFSLIQLGNLRTRLSQEHTLWSLRVVDLLIPHTQALRDHILLHLREETYSDIFISILWNFVYFTV